MKNGKYRIDSREDWLNAAVAELRHVFEAAGYAMHQSIRVSCGWPGGRRGKKAIGQCWSRECSTGGNFELFISPVLAESERVLDVLVHELVHVVVGIKAGHRSAFAKCAAAVHLVAPWTATTAGPGFAEHVAGPVLEALGVPYPHAAMLSGEHSGPKKQGTRLVKCSCPSCGAIWRMTRQWIDAAEAGLACPVCGKDAVSE